MQAESHSSWWNLGTANPRSKESTTSFEQRMKQQGMFRFRGLTVFF
jgi:hypothetical protein